MLFDRYFDDLDTNYVVIDNENSTHHGTQHLLSRGYRNIGFITIDVDQIQMKGRLDGYLNAISENKLKSYVLKKSTFVMGLTSKGRGLFISI